MRRERELAGDRFRGESFGIDRCIYMLDDVAQHREDVESSSGRLLKPPRTGDIIFKER